MSTSPAESNSDLDRTAELIDHARAGDRRAQDDLFRRYGPKLQGFMHARLPREARTLMETQDLVQSVCIRAFKTLDRFHYQGVGSFWAYLRGIAGHRLIDIKRKRPSPEPLPEKSTQAPEVAQPSPSMEAQRQEELEAYEKSLQALPEKVRHAVLMRLELRANYELIASDCGYPSPAAARMAIKRALIQMGGSMSEHDD